MWLCCVSKFCDNLNLDSSLLFATARVERGLDDGLYHTESSKRQTKYVAIGKGLRSER